MSADRNQAHSGLSVTTLMIASASSLVAAVVVSRVWGGGTLLGAAVTPVIVAVVSEGLKRPVQVVGTVRERRTAARFDPVAEGRRGLREGDLHTARPVEGGAAPDRRTVHAVPPRGGLRMPRPRLIAAVVTGIAAFALAGALLTGTELVFGHSSVASSSKRTTLLGGGTSKSKTKQSTGTQKTTTATTPTATTTTPTTATGQSTTTTAPTTTATAPTTSTAAPQQAVPPVQSTAPPAAPAPSTQAAPQAAPAPQTTP